MKLHDSGLITLIGSDGPFCPQFEHPLHLIRSRMVDIAWEATPRNDNGEATSPELDTLNYELSYGLRSDARMRLYRAVVTADNGRGGASIEALYFKCGVCDLILPANRMIS